MSWTDLIHEHWRWTAMVVGGIVVFRSFVSVFITSRVTRRL